MAMMNRISMIIAIGVLAAACGTDSEVGNTTTTHDTTTTTTIPGVNFPTDPGVPVLMVEVGGGLTTMEMALTNMPSVVIYGDGTVVTQGAVPAIFPGPALPPLFTGTLDPETVSALLADALAAGVGSEDLDFGDIPVADAPSTVIRVITDGGEASTGVYALGFGDPDGDFLTDEQRALRDRFNDLVRSIESAAADVAETPYVANELAFLVTPYTFEPDPPQTEMAWPLDDLATIGVDLNGVRCATVSGADLDAVTAALADANSLTPWTSEGDRYALTWRPLLPHENGCEALTG